MRARRSFPERLRMAALTLWLPIMALAIIPAVVVGAMSSQEMIWAVVTAGGVLFGGGLVYLLVARHVRHRETYGMSAAAIGAALLSITASGAFMWLLPWALMFLTEGVDRFSHRSVKDKEK